MDDKRRRAIASYKEKALSRAKKTLDSQDMKKDISDKVDLDDMIENIGSKPKSDGQLEKEAEKKYKRERILRGLSR